MRDVWQLLQPELGWLAIPIAVVIVVLAFRLIRPGTSVPRIRISARGALVVLAVLVGALLFTPVSRTTHARYLDLDLIGTVDAAFTNRILFAQMVGNVLLLCWLGFLLPIAFGRIRPWMAVVVALLTSVTVEVVQYAIAVGRVSSLSDIVFNTVGAAGGACLAAAFDHLYLARRPRLTQPPRPYGNVPSAGM